MRWSNVIAITVASATLRTAKVMASRDSSSATRLTPRPGSREPEPGATLANVIGCHSAIIRFASLYNKKYCEKSNAQQTRATLQFPLA